MTCVCTLKISEDPNFLSAEIENLSTLKAEPGRTQLHKMPFPFFPHSITLYYYRKMVLSPDY